METNTHRNNLAEWVMFIALLPLVPVAWLFERLRPRNDRDADRKNSN
jgi:hypothetical protein